MKLKKILGDLSIMTRAERNGAIVLIALIVLVMIIRFTMPLLFKKDESYLKEIEQKIAFIEQQDSLKNLLASKSVSTIPTSEKNNQASSKPVELVNFNPNTVTAKELSDLGFSSKVANTIINYRAKGGIFKKKMDLLKVYGLDTAFYEKIEPYITIPEDLVKHKAPETYVETKKTEKSEVFIEINSADSASWTTLPGIGPVFAKRICAFRKNLGGFVSINQLKEVYKFPEETYNAILGQLTIDVSQVQTININFADINELKHHPYCNFEMAKKITDYRSLRGSFGSVNQLLNDSVLNGEQFVKFSPYLRVN